jgi:hypothetical protein
MAGYTVTTLVDEGFDSGDLASETDDGFGLSLREALALANGNTEADEITFAASLAGGTLTLGGTELSITSDVTIDGDVDGDDKADITIDADDSSRVFSITGGTSTLASLVMTGGYTPAGVDGGALNVVGGDLTIVNSTISDSHTGGAGGGIFNRTALTLVNTAVTGNESNVWGGGVANYKADASLTAVNTIFAGNEVSGLGGGLFNHTLSSAHLVNLTMTGNLASSGGGFIGDGTLTMTNSVVAGNQAGAYQDGVSLGPTIYSGANIIGDTLSDNGVAQQTGIALSDVFAVLGADPHTGVTAGTLADNGGVVQTIAIKQGGVAQNAGDDAELPVDAQDIDGDGNETEALPVDALGLGFDRVALGQSDIGAFEQQSLVVDTLDDEDAATTDLATEADDGDGLSLREALAIANANADFNAITFDASLSGGTLFLISGQRLSITTDGVTIDGDIDGDGTADITVDADSADGLDDAASRVFFISDNNNATTISAALNGLVIRDGKAAGGSGGGIYIGQADGLCADQLHPVGQPHRLLGRRDFYPYQRHRHAGQRHAVGQQRQFWRRDFQRQLRHRHAGQRHAVGQQRQLWRRD